MIRVLVMIAVAGFLLSAACLTGAVAIGGPDAIARGAWTWNDGHGWSHRHDRDDGQPASTRDIPWTGGTTLDVEIPADIQYVQAAGPAKLTVVGSRRAVEAVSLKNGVLSFSHGRHRWGPLTVTMQAPNINRFNLRGANKLTIDGYNQPSLALDLSGDADVAAKGQTKALDLDISGSAEADLSELKAASADVQISGSGEAKIAPTDSAKLSISGSGNVDLLTRPAHLDTDISGSGRVQQGGADEATPKPSAAPSPSPSAKKT
jgi:hypothetical protein